LGDTLPFFKLADLLWCIGKWAVDAEAKCCSWAQLEDLGINCNKFSLDDEFDLVVSDNGLDGSSMFSDAFRLLPFLPPNKSGVRLWRFLSGTDIPNFYTEKYSYREFLNHVFAERLTSVSYDSSGPLKLFRTFRRDSFKRSISYFKVVFAYYEYTTVEILFTNKVQCAIVYSMTCKYTSQRDSVNGLQDQSGQIGLC
jgi:hypothetical protein